MAPRVRAVAPRVTVAAIMAAVLMVPVYLPYRRVARDQQMVRTLDVVKDFSATLKGYLAAAGTFHYSTWSAAFFKDPIDSFFPGVTIIVLTVVAIVLTFRRASERRDDPCARVSPCERHGIVGFVLSLARPHRLRLGVHVFPPMQGRRLRRGSATCSFSAVACLGGLGLALWRPGRYVSLALAVVQHRVAARAAVPYTPFEGIPGIYRLLAEQPGSRGVAEQPFFPRA